METKEESVAPTLLSHALKWGVINAAVGIVLVVVLYAIDYTMLVSFKFLIAIIVCSLGIVIASGIDYRKSVGGFLSYGKAWQHDWLTFAIAGLISVLFSMLLYFVIDTELPAKLLDATMENTRQMMENFGAPEDQIDTEMEKARARTENQFKFTGMLMGYGIQLIIYTVLAAITAIFTKKTLPVEQM